MGLKVEKENAFTRDVEKETKKNKSFWFDYCCFFLTKKFDSIKQSIYEVVQTFNLL